MLTTMWLIMFASSFPRWVTCLGIHDGFHVGFHAGYHLLSTLGCMLGSMLDSILGVFHVALHIALLASVLGSMLSPMLDSIMMGFAFNVGRLRLATNVPCSMLLLQSAGHRAPCCYGWLTMVLDFSMFLGLHGALQYHFSFFAT